MLLDTESVENSVLMMTTRDTKETEPNRQEEKEANDDDGVSG